MASKFWDHRSKLDFNFLSLFQQSTTRVSLTHTKSEWGKRVQPRRPSDFCRSADLDRRCGDFPSILITRGSLAKRAHARRTVIPLHVSDSFLGASLRAAVKLYGICRASSLDSSNILYPHGTMNRWYSFRITIWLQTLQRQHRDNSEALENLIAPYCEHEMCPYPLILPKHSWNLSRALSWKNILFKRHGNL